MSAKDPTNDELLRGVIDFTIPGMAQRAADAGLKAGYDKWKPVKIILKDGSEFGHGEVAATENKQVTQEEVEMGWDIYEADLKTAGYKSIDDF